MSPAAIDAALVDDHARMDRALDDIVALAKKDDLDGLRRRWPPFEESLLAHLEAEEVFLLPAIPGALGPEGDALLVEHAKFRAAVAEIGIGIDLHTTRADRIEDLARALRAHVAGEEHTLYPQARDGVLPSVLTAARRRLRAARLLGRRRASTRNLV
jgi:hypothetical protein